VSALWISNGATVNMVGCSFTRNFITGAKLNDAVISVNAVQPNGSIYGRAQDTMLRFQQCSEENNHGRFLSAYNEGSFGSFDVLIFSDGNFTVNRVINLGEVKYEDPLPLTDPQSRRGIDNSSDWFLQTLQVCTLKAFAESTQNNHTNTCLHSKYCFMHHAGHSRISHACPRSYS
jgi:hypothetical protein